MTIWARPSFSIFECRELDTESAQRPQAVQFSVGGNWADATDLLERGLLRSRLTEQEFQQPFLRQGFMIEIALHGLAPSVFQVAFLNGSLDTLRDEVQPQTFRDRDNGKHNWKLRTVVLDVHDK